MKRHVLLAGKVVQQMGETVHFTCVQALQKHRDSVVKYSFWSLSGYKATAVADKYEHKNIYKDKHKLKYVAIQQ